MYPYFIEDWKMSKSFFLLIGLVGIGQGMMNLARLAIQVLLQGRVGGGTRSNASCDRCSVSSLDDQTVVCISVRQYTDIWRTQKTVHCDLFLDQYGELDRIGLRSDFVRGDHSRDPVLLSLVCIHQCRGEALIVEKSAGRHFEYSIFLLTIFWSCTYARSSVRVFRRKTLGSPDDTSNVSSSQHLHLL